MPGDRGELAVEPVQRLDVAGKVGILRPGDVGVKHDPVDQSVDAVVAVVAQVLVVLIGIHRVDADSGDGRLRVDFAYDPALEADDVHHIIHGAVKVLSDHWFILRLPNLHQSFAGEDFLFQLLFQLRPLLLFDRHHLLEGIQDVHAANDVDRFAGGDLLRSRLDRLKILFLENGEKKLAIPFGTAEPPEFRVQPAPHAESRLRSRIVIFRERRGDCESGRGLLDAFALFDHLGRNSIIARFGDLDREFRTARL